MTDSVNVPSESLADRAAHAARWRLGGSIFGAGSQFATGVLLARLLAPADFGLVALAAVVLGFARTFNDLGIGNALVQRAAITTRHVRSAFTFSLLLGIGVAAVIGASAPVWAAALHDARVAPVLRVLAVGFAVGGTSVVAGALLRRQLKFKAQFFIDAVSSVVGFGVVSVALALTGHGVWSLVWGGLCQTLIAACAQLAVVRHSVRPLLAREEMTDLLHFGFGSAANGLVNYIALNADNFVVGRWVGAAGLGLYNRAYTLMNVPYTYGASVMSSVLFPALARVQHDSARVRRAYLLITRLTAMVAASAMGTLAIVAPHLVSALYGPKWNGVVLPLQILCIAGYFRSLYHIGGVVAQSVGRVYSELTNETVYAALVIGGSLIGSRYGLVGVAGGVGMAILYMFFATARLVLGATGTSLRQYVQVQLGALATGAVTCAVALATRLVMESGQFSSFQVMLGVLATAAVPWAIGMTWTLGERDCEQVLGYLPSSCAWAVGALRRFTRHTPVPLPVAPTGQ
jgi:teichuronic acid exporter